MWNKQKFQGNNQLNSNNRDQKIERIKDRKKRNK